MVGTRQAPEVTSKFPYGNADAFWLCRSEKAPLNRTAWVASDMVMTLASADSELLPINPI